MTVNYMHRIGTATKFTGFAGFTPSVLLRWRGSLLQAVYWQILLYLLAYVALLCIYLFVLRPNPNLVYYRW